MTELNQRVDQDAVAFLSELKQSLVDGTTVVVGTVEEVPAFVGELFFQLCTAEHGPFGCNK
ncbi:hypothetical protein ACP3W2_25195 [Salmonella enterica]|uniref:hypothetical protein n=1 Tax=Salmonella enterica TaxID=28901 RepID=UPI003CE6C438